MHDVSEHERRLNLGLYIGHDAHDERDGGGARVLLDTEPAGGRSRVPVRNWLTAQVVDTVELAVATVPGTDNGNFKVTGPSGSVPAGTPFDLTLAWNEPKPAVGESWFALAEYGSENANPTETARCS